MIKIELTSEADLFFHYTSSYNFSIKLEQITLISHRRRMNNILTLNLNNIFKHW
jgi:hypothetical protein